MIDFDYQLAKRGVRLVEDIHKEKFHVISAKYLSPEEAHGLHHILVDVLDEQGKRLFDIPVRFWWADGQSVVKTNKVTEDYAVDFPMYAAGNAYNVEVFEAMGNSDAVMGMGLGTIELPNQGIHVSYKIVFQRTQRNGEIPTEDSILTIVKRIELKVDMLLSRTAPFG